MELTASNQANLTKEKSELETKLKESETEKEALAATLANLETKISQKEDMIA